MSVLLVQMCHVTFSSSFFRMFLSFSQLGRRLLNKYDSLSSPTPSRHTEHVDDGQPRLTPWFEQGVSVKASLPG